jgi:glucose-1-phosphate thymidylyltransferase
VTLENAEIGPNVSISAGAVIRGTKLRDAIVGETAVLEDCDLHDSLVGAHARVTGVRGQADVGDHSVVSNGG